MSSWSRGLTCVQCVFMQCMRYDIRKYRDDQQGLGDDLLAAGQGSLNS